MQTDAQVRKSAGRLSREDQRRLGDILQRAYDDVIRQGVPDRFKDLLKELDDVNPNDADRRGMAHGQADGDENHDATRAVDVKGHDHNKESH